VSCRSRPVYAHGQARRPVPTSLRRTVGHSAATSARERDMGERRDARAVWAAPAGSRPGYGGWVASLAVDIAATSTRERDMAECRAAGRRWRPAPAGSRPTFGHSSTGRTFGFADWRPGATGPPLPDRGQAAADTAAASVWRTGGRGRGRRWASPCRIAARWLPTRRRRACGQTKTGCLGQRVH
jgi:hypothetical protein